MARKFARHQQKGHRVGATSMWSRHRWLLHQGQVSKGWRLPYQGLAKQHIWQLCSYGVGSASVRGLFFVPFFGPNQKVVSTVKNQADVIMSCQGTAGWFSFTLSPSHRNVEAFDLLTFKKQWFMVFGENWGGFGYLLSNIYTPRKLTWNLNIAFSWVQTSSKPPFCGFKILVVGVV